LQLNLRTREEISGTGKMKIFFVRSLLILCLARVSSGDLLSDIVHGLGKVAAFLNGVEYKPWSYQCPSDTPCDGENCFKSTAYEEQKHCCFCPAADQQACEDAYNPWHSPQKNKKCYTFEINAADYMEDDDIRTDQMENSQWIHQYYRCVCRD